MAFHKQAYESRELCNGIVRTVEAWVGGGAAADCTRLWGDGNVSSVAYNAATGKYLITFRDIAANATFVPNIQAYGATTTKQNVKYGLFNVANKTLEIYVYADTTLTDLLTDSVLTIEITWFDSTVDR